MSATLFSFKDRAAKFAVVIFAVFFIVTPFFQANAQTARATMSEAELRALISELLERISVLQSQLGVLQPGGSGVIPIPGAFTPSPSSPGRCVFAGGRDLSWGSSGSDVLQLQRVLNADPDTRINVPAGAAGSAGYETEYFGVATHEAVIRFQEKYRSQILVPAGLERGSGFVGSATRIKLSRLCGNLGSDQPGNNASDFSVSPIRGTAPLTVTASFGRGACSAYTIDWGDGNSTNLSAPRQSRDQVCTMQWILEQKTHTYNRAGTYTIRFRLDGGAAVTQQVTVGTVPPVTEPGQSSADFSISPIQGTAPLTVTANLGRGACSSYTIDWGDGNMTTRDYRPATVPNSRAVACTMQLILQQENHTYDRAGTYTVRFRLDGGTAVTQNVVVSAASSQSPQTSSRTTLNLSVSSASVQSGGSATITWTTANATNCYASAVPSLASWSGTPNANGGSLVLNNITESRTYLMQCTGSGGSTAVQSIGISVAGAGATGPSLTLTANPTSVPVGNPSQITWTTANVTSCSSWSSPSYNQWNSSKNASGGTQTVPNITETRTYYMQCSGPGGTTPTESVTVAVSETGPTLAITASPASVRSGGSATVTWTTTNATSCTASATPSIGTWSGSKNANGGSQTITNITQTRVYTMICSGVGGTTTPYRSAVVEVSQN